MLDGARSFACHALKLLGWGKEVSGIQVIWIALVLFKGSTFQIVFRLLSTATVYPMLGICMLALKAS